MNGFKNIHYDNSHNRIYLWENGEDGKTNRFKDTPEIEYYVTDKSNTSKIKDIWGNSVVKKTAKNTYTLRKTLESDDIVTCEAKLQQDMKFLQKRYGDKDLTYDMDDFQICTIDIELAVGDKPKPFAEMVEDCDTPINLITVHFSKDDSVHTFGTTEYTGNSDTVGTYHYIPDESMMLTKFIKMFRRKKVDIITGWNSRFFDIRYIVDRCRMLDVTVSLSPLNKEIESKMRDNFGGTIKYYKIPGVAQLDSQELYKKFTFIKEVNYKLNYIGNKVTGEGKLDLDGSVTQIYKTNWNQFVEYNIQDVMLVKKINDTKKFIDLTVNICYQSLIPFESIFSSIPVITGYIVRYLHKFGLVMPDSKGGEKESYPGAYVKSMRGMYKYLVSYDFESLYPTIMRMFNISPETLVFNPTEEQLRTMDLIKTPASTMYECETPKGEFKVSGIYYDKSKRGILPQIVETIFNERKYFKQKMKIAKGISKGFTQEHIAKDTHMSIELVNKLYDEVMEEGFDADYYDSQQHIRKILINSIYGVLGNRHFAFYNIKNAMAITIAGRDVIQYVTDSVNDYFINYWHKHAHRYLPELKGVDIKPMSKDSVPVVDTDSNYICLDELLSNMNITFETNEEYRLWVDRFDQLFLTPFFKKILAIYAKKYNADNLHNFKREKIIIRKLVSQKKRYADIVIENEGDVYETPKLSITGLDIVKSSTPMFCRTNLKDALYYMMMTSDRDKTTDILRDIYEEFKASDIEQISSPRRVNNYTKYAESLDYYETNGVFIKKGTPQHVKSSIYYNHVVNIKKIKGQSFIENGNDIKYIYVNPDNIVRSPTIAFSGKYPEEFKSIFNIDYNAQWNKTFLNTMNDFFDIMGWGKVTLEKNNLDDFITF